MKKVPVFLINGFLDSGKTNFVESIIRSDEFYKKGNSLIIVCEEGELEYDKFTLYDRFYTNILFIDDPKALDSSKLQKIAEQYDADRIIVETNAMWDSKLDFQDNLEVVQEITLIDTQTFENYFANIRQRFVEILKKADVIVFNRIDNKKEKLLSYKRSLMLINAEADYVFQSNDGEIMDTLDEELPYDLNAPVMKIKDEDYGIWYIDSYNQRDRYESKTVNFNGIIYNDKQLTNNETVIGRMAMTCCENDITLLGSISKCPKAFPDKTWVNVTAKIVYEQRGGEKEEPVLEVKEIKTIKEIKNPIISL